MSQKMSEKVMAKVNGREITERDLAIFFRSLGQQVQQQFQGDDGKQRLLDELIYQELFYAEAIDEKLEEKEDFIEELTLAKENLLKQYNIRKLIGSIEITDEEAEGFYNENPQYFEDKEQIKASHILVETEEEANKIIEEMNGELSFEDAAMKYSTCPSNQQGGDLGFFAKGQMVPEFEAAAFEMEIGTTSAPVKTQFGFHIIKKTDAKEASVKPFSEVADQIKQQLLIQKQNTAYLDKVNALKAVYTVEVL